ncbi:MAG: DUF6065 family protein [Rhodothermales bacterium]
MKLIAHRIDDATKWSIEPAPKKRHWMDETSVGYAYRCLPLTMANSAGWVISCPVGFTAVWNGELHDFGGVTLTFGDAATELDRKSILSHFGSGIITFHLPYLFRTEPGVVLLARGAPNAPKYNVAALEGLIETDWLPFTFTMNWQIQRPHIPVSFKAGEPICFIQPFSVPLLESVEPEIQPIEADPELHEQFLQWKRSRKAFLARDDRATTEWQKNYTRGQDLDGTKAVGHRTSLKVQRFERR